ncbi:ParB/RepB/Spo0J family partition protein [Gemmobacter sp.]|uniref:ParB/RepB/Spo0J family partition protein n=1 Tax=Gemmobacter sp. TaxID=1898957 RepID=UPI002AFFA056|nr:ParB N-terminal domain-containing protein [Gemmobacter sp.]
MTSLSILDLPIRDIDVPADRARDYDENAALALAAVIAEQGLQHPIRVRRTGDRFQLVSGLRRLRAYELNQQTTIPATITSADSDDAARLEEVMENLGREELIALDRCHHLYELKVVWERLHPSFANGGGNQRGKNGGKTFPTDPEAPEVFGFAASVAEAVGLSKRTINAAVKIWQGLSPSSRTRLAGTALATKQTELKALSEEGPARQARILDLILGDEAPEVQNVSAALAFMDGGAQPTDLERRYRVVAEGLKALPDDSFDLLVIENEERVLAALKRKGRI